MAIRIIKEGNKTKFIKTCPDCGCEFEYELEDLEIDFTVCLTTYPCKYNTYVKCPCCGKHIHHGTTSEDTWPLNKQIIYYNTYSYQELDCDKCPNKPDPNRPIQAGDTPCTWCPKMRPTCVGK